MSLDRSRGRVPLGPTGGRALAAAATLTLAGVLAWPAPPAAEGYDLIGGALGLVQRDVRVHDNFTDATANDNQSPHSSFPGGAGAELAIWKASVEWGSTLHGDGQGDPHQPGGLGSGGANFDPTWQGLATTVGGTNGNVHSELSGSDGGVLAYCETPIADGWRIRYYRDWTWDDGPGTSVTGKDLQGIATHEYGHALGLGHSSVPGATMFPTVAGSGVAQRSIEADDAAGLQALYGIAAPSKPRIVGSAVTAGTLTLFGQNFAPAGNELWFTKRGVNANGVPVLALGVPSTEGGTRVDVAIPPDAGPGDVLLRVPGNGHAALSNAWPLDPDVDSSSGGDPTVTAIVPSTVPALGLDPVVVTLSGSDLSGVSAVSVDGVPVPQAKFSVLGNGELSFEVPLVDELGPAPITLTGPLGNVVVGELDVVPPDPPALRLSSALAFSSSGLDLWVGSDTGDIAFVAVSPDLVPSALPGIVDLSIGAQFQSLFVLANHTLGASGWSTQHVDVGGLAFGTKMHFQAAVWDPTAATPPFAASNVASSTFYF